MFKKICDRFCRCDSCAKPIVRRAEAEDNLDASPRDLRSFREATPT